MTIDIIAQFVFSAIFLVWYFSVKANRECFLAMMLIGLPIGALAALTEWFMK